MQRGNGIFLGVSSLPGSYGIGTLGEAAREFVDMLALCGQKYWQILPLSPTGYADSPYQSASVFAGNPYFIDFGELHAQGLLTKNELNECAGLFGDDEEAVDYEKQFQNKGKFLRQAYCRGIDSKKDAFEEFLHDNEYWIYDYALYMALKGTFDLKSFREWPKGLARAEEDAIKAARETHREEIEYHAFIQYLFFSQWQSIKAYANGKGVQIIGDMPIYVAGDSADAWLNAGLFDPEGEVAGCPPDYFSCTGQLWGNPVYNWDAHKRDGYAWWIKRVRHNMRLYDYIRIDHFRGFESYYSLHRDSLTAEGGRWIKGPGMELFDALKESLGDLPFIAEDLGLLTPEVRALLEATGFPGLKVLQFAFEPGAKSIYLPHQYTRHCVVYTGTHDNDTTAGWYRSLSDAEKSFIEDYIGGVDETNIHWKLIRLAMGSVADLCILPMQDLLGLSSAARMNTPQTAEGNWKWRLRMRDFTAGLAEKLKILTEAYGR